MDSSLSRLVRCSRSFDFRVRVCVCSFALVLFLWRAVVSSPSCNCLAASLRAFFSHAELLSQRFYVLRSVLISKRGTGRGSAGQKNTRARQRGHRSASRRLIKKNKSKIQAGHRPGVGKSRSLAHARLGLFDACSKNHENHGHGHKIRFNSNQVTSNNNNNN